MHWETAHYQRLYLDCRHKGNIVINWSFFSIYCKIPYKHLTFCKEYVQLSQRLLSPCVVPTSSYTPSPWVRIQRLYENMNQCHCVWDAPSQNQHYKYHLWSPDLTSDPAAHQRVKAKGMEEKALLLFFFLLLRQTLLLPDRPCASPETWLSTSVGLRKYLYLTFILGGE